MDGRDVVPAVLTGGGVLTVAVGIGLALGIAWGLVAGGGLTLLCAAILVWLNLLAAAVPDEPEPET